MTSEAVGGRSDEQYANLPYGRRDLAQAMREAYGELIEFVTTDEFKSAMEEMGALDARARPAFVVSVFLNPAALRDRGIETPDGILIQRSAFGDRRPTLFCVKKYLPAEFSDVWQNVNLTFDNEFLDASVSRAPEVAWREPLQVDLQAQAMTNGEDLQEIS